MKRHSIPELRARKGGTPLVVCTAYTAPFARILDAHADILLVGDSLGMVLYAMPSTLPVTLDMMIAHGRAVTVSSKRACVVVDMPFGSYQQSKEQAFAACARVMAETNGQAVKLEGGAEMAETIRFLTQRGIPVMAHVGLMPQRVHAHGGYRFQGRTPAEKDAILHDAVSAEQAGAFSIVLEAVEEDLARQITAKLSIPTIGIGASSACDGQVLVSEDMAGLSGHTARFVKAYGDLAGALDKAAAQFAADVRARTFPGPEHVYHRKDD